MNDADRDLFRQHASSHDRRRAARASMERLALTIPVLLDDLDNTAARSYNSLSPRMHIVDEDGRVAYTSHPVPFGFLPARLEARLKVVLDPGLVS